MQNFLTGKKRDVIVTVHEVPVIEQEKFYFSEKASFIWETGQIPGCLVGRE